MVIIYPILTTSIRHINDALARSEAITDTTLTSNIAQQRSITGYYTTRNNLLQQLFNIQHFSTTAIHMCNSYLHPFEN